MALLRTLIFVAIFYPGSVPLVVAAFAAIPFGADAVEVLARSWSGWHRFCARYLLGIRIRIDGVLPQSGTLVVFKHESMFETIEIPLLFRRPAIVFKRELLDIPLWGRAALMHGAIPIDRDSGAAALRKMVAAGKAALAEGRPIILFPEGTRVPHGERPPLGAGLAGLYRMLGVPLVPVAVDAGKVWPRGFVKYAGVVTIKVGEAIPPGLPRGAVEAQVHAAINALNG